MNKFFAILGSVFVALSAAASAVDFPEQLGQGSAGKHPYNLVGQVFFDSGRSSYIGSGTVIRAKSILTAGHNLYDPKNGWSTEILFRRAAYGATAASENYGTRILLLGGYKASANRYGSESARTFASDTGGVRFGVQLANGGYAGYATNTIAPLSNAGVYKIALGYGVTEKYDGDYPLFVVPDRAFTSAYRTFYESRGVYFAGGMSGGPVFVNNSAGQPRVMGVIVSGSDYPYYSGGIRILDATVGNFITGYLR